MSDNHAVDAVLSPNQTPFPSSIVNNPQFAPFVDAPDPAYFDQVNCDTAQSSPIGPVEYMDQGPRDMLMALRLQFPYWEVIPFPPRVKTVFLANANQAVDVRIPDGTVGIVMRGNLDYYVCNVGIATVPAAANANSDDTSTECQSMYKPEGYIMYVGNLKSLSIVAPNANTIVTMMCYMLTGINPR